MEQVGITLEGAATAKFIAKFYFQDGVPLCFVFDKLKSYNILPSWNHLYDELVDNGMKHERIIHLLHEHIFESYGKEFRDVVIERLKKKQIKN